MLADGRRRTAGQWRPRRMLNLRLLAGLCVTVVGVAARVPGLFFRR